MDRKSETLQIYPVDSWAMLAFIVVGKCIICLEFSHTHLDANIWGKNFKTWFNEYKQNQTQHFPNMNTGKIKLNDNDLQLYFFNLRGYKRLFRIFFFCMGSSFFELFCI